jgi:SAM-dependent methyltransferase
MSTHEHGATAVEAVRARLYPEVRAGGFSRFDGAVQFYQRVNALLDGDDVILDFGAGRAHWADPGANEARRKLRDLRGRVKRVIGVDVDDAVLTNPVVSEAHVIEPSGRIPLDDACVDVIVSDYTFEHVSEPAAVAAELDRVLVPGGWICARTPNKWGYIGLGARLVPNERHVRALGRLQPHRKAEDVFPVRYRLNTAGAIRAAFPGYEHVVYGWSAEPAYAGTSPLAWRAFQVLDAVSPPSLRATFMVFLRKPSGSAPAGAGSRTP